MHAEDAVITIPIAVHAEPFRWQLDLFWYAHRAVYGGGAYARAHAAVIKRNCVNAGKVERMFWGIDVPHTMCEAYFDIAPRLPGVHLISSKLIVGVPLNIQAGLYQVLPRFADHQILEVVDCDMFHFRPSPVRDVGANQLLVSDVYENWHLFSRTGNRHVISPYFENEGRYYNGGFVPIIGHAATFRRILPEWINVHIDILRRDFGGSIHWWAGMFALQAACEKARVEMIGHDCCRVPPVNGATRTQYIGHYSVDPIFDKRSFPNIDVTKFEANDYYRLIANWMQHRLAG